MSCFENCQGGEGVDDVKLMNSVNKVQELLSRG